MATITATAMAPTHPPPGPMPVIMPAQVPASFATASQPSVQATSVTTTPKTVGGPNPEVVCPLLNSDGTSCRKKCSGTFAYRSICEHIRRAHPDNWIPRLPASAESFRRMVEATSRQHLASGVAPSLGSQTAPMAENSDATIRKSIGGSALPKSRAKAQPRPKTSVMRDYAGHPSPPTSLPESEALLSLPVNVSYKEGLYDKNFEHVTSGPVSETDTESDGTHSTASPPAPRVTQSQPTSRKPTKPRNANATGISRKKSTSLAKLPRRDRRRLEKNGKVNSSTAYSTPVRSSSDLKSLASNPDLMEVDENYKPGDAGGFGYGVPSDETGNFFTSLSRPRQSHEHGAPSLRRSHSFSIGDNGHLEHAGTKKMGLVLDTNISNKSMLEAGSMSAGGVVGERKTLETASRWEELIQAATEAGQAEKASPLLYQPISGARTSLVNSSASSSHYSSRNPSMSSASTPRNPFGPELPPSLIAMMDLAESERRAKEAAEQIQFHQHYQPNVYAHNQHTEPLHFQSSLPYAAASMHSQVQHHMHMSIPASSYEYQYQQLECQSAPRSSVATPALQRRVTNHTNISPILRGTTIASATNSPPYTTLNSPTLSPKIQCSLCNTHVDLTMSLACTECINGFCYNCVAPIDEFGAQYGNGSNYKISRDGIEDRVDAKNIYKSKNYRKHGCVTTGISKCGVCGVQEPRFKPIRINVVV